MTVSVVVLCLLVSVALGMVRFLRGPTDADRIVALDILFAAAVALCGVAAVYTQRALFLDIAIGIALTGFVATLAWARLVETRNPRRQQEAEH